MYRLTRYTTAGLTAGASTQRRTSYVDVERAAVQRTYMLATGSRLTDDAVAKLRDARHVARMACGDTLIVERV